jgi:hypothetical protein
MGIAYSQAMFNQFVKCIILPLMLFASFFAYGADNSCAVAIDNPTFVAIKAKRSVLYFHSDFAKLRQFNNVINKETATQLSIAYKRIFFQKLSENQLLYNTLLKNEKGERFASSDYKVERFGSEVTLFISESVSKSQMAIAELILELRSFVNDVADEFETEVLSNKGHSLTATQIEFLENNLKRLKISGVGDSADMAAVAAKRNRGMEDHSNIEGILEINIAYFNYIEDILKFELKSMNHLLFRISKQLGPEKLNLFMRQLPNSEKLVLTKKTIKAFKKGQLSVRLKDANYYASIAESFYKAFKVMPDRSILELINSYLHYGDTFIMSPNNIEATHLGFGQVGDGAKFIIHADVTDLGVENIEASLNVLTENPRESVFFARKAEARITKWLGKIKDQIAEVINLAMSGDEGVLISKDDLNETWYKESLFKLFSKVDKRRVRISTLDGGSRGLSKLSEGQRSEFLKNIEIKAKEIEQLLDNDLYYEIHQAEGIIGIAVIQKIYEPGAPYEIQIYGSELNKVQTKILNDLIKEMPSLFHLKVTFISKDGRQQISSHEFP